MSAVSGSEYDYIDKPKSNTIAPMSKERFIQELILRYVERGDAYGPKSISYAWKLYQESLEELH